MTYVFPTYLNFHDREKLMAWNLDKSAVVKMADKRSAAARTSHGWYATRRWQSQRASQLEAEPFCRFCLDAGDRVRATVADHIKPHRGDAALFWDARNLQSLCRLHHGSTKARQERRGVTIGCGVDGWPLDEGQPPGG
jgi:5-methylcytosine-specific restriction enzyme A